MSGNEFKTQHYNNFFFIQSTAFNDTHSCQAKVCLMCFDIKNDVHSAVFFFINLIHTYRD